MKFKKFILCLMACILGLSILLPVRTFADNNNLNINAESAILLDGDTGKVLYEKSAKDVYKRQCLYKTFCYLIMYYFFSIR